MPREREARKMGTGERVCITVASVLIGAGLAGYGGYNIGKNIVMEVADMMIPEEITDSGRHIGGGLYTILGAGLGSALAGEATRRFLNQTRQ